MLPHLRQAYVDRATVCIVQVGAKETQTSSELGARHITVSSVLDPRLGAALGAEHGRATPLAHGLDLAYQVLLKTLRHGRSSVQQAHLVVVSDGRGNVPLSASRAGEVNEPVGRKGVEDALEIAKRISCMPDVHRTLLDPQPLQHAELPVALADALGADIVPIPLLEEAGL